MIQDKKAGLKEMYESINEAKINNKTELYHGLLKNVTKMVMKKDIASYLVEEQENGTSNVLIGK